MRIQTYFYRQLLQKFDTHILSSKSLKSGNSYTGQIRDFLIYLEQHHIYELKNVSVPFMQQYFAHLSTRPKARGTGFLNLRTINDNLNTLRLFSLRMQEEGFINKGLPVPNNIKIDKDHDNPFVLVRQILSLQEIKELFDACQSELERAIIALAYGCGLRRSDLVNLSEFNINFERGSVTIIKSKNNKTRQVPLSDFFLNVVKEYYLWRLNILAEVGIHQKAFFVDHRGHRVLGARMNMILKRVILRTKNRQIIAKNITLHCLRHSIATHLMDNGQSFEYVREFLGHASADTTLIYARRRKIKSVYTL